MEQPILGKIWPKLFWKQFKGRISYCQTIYDLHTYFQNLSKMAAYQYAACSETPWPKKKIIIEETFQGNTVTQSIEDETKAQDFSLRVTRRRYQFPMYGLAGVVKKNTTMSGFHYSSMNLL